MAEEKKTKSAPKKSAPTKEEPKKEEPTKEEPKTESAKPGEAAQKAVEATSDAAKVAYEATRDAAMSAFKAATVVVTDPMGGQSKAMNSLGDKGSLAAGIFFVALFVVLGYLFNMAGNFGNHLKLIGMWVMAPAALLGAFYVLGLVFKKPLSLAKALFCAGVTIFPLTVAVVLMGLGIFTGWIDTIIMVYGLSILVLLISGFLQDVLKATTQQAVLLAPTVLVVMFVVVYVYLRIAFGGVTARFLGVM